MTRTALIATAVPALALVGGLAFIVSRASVGECQDWPV